MIRPGPATAALAAALLLAACAAPRAPGGGAGAPAGAQGGAPGGGGNGAAAAPEAPPAAPPADGRPGEAVPPAGQAAPLPEGASPDGLSACEQSIRRAQEQGLPVPGDCSGELPPVPPPGAAGGQEADPLRDAENAEAMAALIRAAAENERDPVVRARLWEEYRRYTGEEPPAR